MTIENKNIEDFIICCERIMDNFKEEVDYKLKSGIVTEYSNFQKHFYSSSRYHAPGKKMLRNACWENYKKHRSFCVNLLC